MSTNMKKKVYKILQLNANYALAYVHPVNIIKGKE